ncbi:hypothetical protein ASE75_08460 [Sphingomonas sp. Leaf17]|uniref:glycine zipper 2TM domain-containing protein n=1 Tax=Sphingomonas sp. Leaf17 TaxID=1735683 RepID=UPI0006F2ACC0|nr:glycine zipper 2TM domain-containing protein [Sphingomonas sp. Leaf17]KQM65067.1 hypothetical protein ASE75_08460 [Sphingomonas sp. Leaf17]
MPHHRSSILLLTAAAAVLTLATTAPARAQSSADDARFQQAQARFDREYQIFRDEAARYQASRGRTGGYQDPDSPSQGGYRRAPDPQTRYQDERDEGDYDAAQYYRPAAQDRVLNTNERVYAGQDGRYYCKRSDGTTGLIIGAAGGGILGNVIDGGRSRTVGTLLGAAVGGLAGRSVEQGNSQIRCR